METQKVLNLLNGSDNENLKFATKKKWCYLTKGFYSHKNPIKFLTSSLDQVFVIILVLMFFLQEILLL